MAEDVISSLKRLFCYRYVPFERGLSSPGPELDIQERLRILTVLKQSENLHTRDAKSSKC